MGVGYVLVNRSRAQFISFAHLPTSKVKELAGNSVSAAITTWYLLQNPGDEIAFVSDTDGRWPFSKGIREDLSEYEDVTDDVVQQLIDATILRDDGVAWADPDEPETVYIRDLKNIWMD